jgi:hypothetical protein
MVFSWLVIRRHMELLQKIRKIRSTDPEMPPGQPEGGDLAGAYPAQDGRIANAAAPGD